MTKEEAIQYFHTQKALADALGLSQPTISGWRKIPLHHQNYLERITRRRLRADPHPAEKRDA